MLPLGAEQIRSQYSIVLDFVVVELIEFYEKTVYAGDSVAFTVFLHVAYHFDTTVTHRNTPAICPFTQC